MEAELSSFRRSEFLPPVKRVHFILGHQCSYSLRLLQDCCGKQRKPISKVLLSNMQHSKKTERAARESCLQLEAQITEANFKFDMSEGNLRNFVSLQIRAAMMKSSDQISPILASQM